MSTNSSLSSDLSDNTSDYSTDLTSLNDDNVDDNNNTYNEDNDGVDRQQLNYEAGFGGQEDLDTLSFALSRTSRTPFATRTSNSNLSLTYNPCTRATFFSFTVSSYEGGFEAIDTLSMSSASFVFPLAFISSLYACLSFDNDSRAFIRVTLSTFGDLTTDNTSSCTADIPPYSSDTFLADLPIK
ncbi:hypothetical protein E3Q18_00983 [Wallemia mellicola]|nr:hypothetical protein E3Q19_00480 [Wallemia mellicola]TIC00937.1 hypothetical protein E3Q18_00983 [Wallemia mellicola]